MDEYFKYRLWALVGVFCSSIILGEFIGAHATRTSLTKQAIKAGVAKWVVNPETGETKFEWIKDEK